MNAPSKPRFSCSAVIVLAWLLIVASPAAAADPAAPRAEAATTSADSDAATTTAATTTTATATGDDWTAWVDTERGFLIELPPSHAVAPAGRQWFLHGFYGGEPTVPDATITFLPGRDLPRALKESFPADATITPLTFGDAGTSGLRVTSVYSTPDGTPYEESGYLIEAPGGTYRIGRYESFDWAPFDAAARSFRLVRLVADDTGD